MEAISDRRQSYFISGTKGRKVKIMYDKANNEKFPANSLTNESSFPVVTRHCLPSIFFTDLSLALLFMDTYYYETSKGLFTLCGR